MTEKEQMLLDTLSQWTANDPKWDKDCRWINVLKGSIYKNRIPYVVNWVLQHKDGKLLYKYTPEELQRLDVIYKERPNYSCAIIMFSERKNKFIVSIDKYLARLQENLERSKTYELNINIVPKCYVMSILNDITNLMVREIPKRFIEDIEKLICEILKTEE